jgi:hypothetical protein
MRDETKLIQKEANRMSHKHTQMTRAEVNPRTPFRHLPRKKKQILRLPPVPSPTGIPGWGWRERCPPGTRPAPCATPLWPRPRRRLAFWLATVGAGFAVPGNATDVARRRLELWASRLMASANLESLGSQR